MHALALQKTVGNRAVQQLVNSAVVQRHLGAKGREQVEAVVAKRLFDVDPAQDVSSSSRITGNKLTIEAVAQQHPDAKGREKVEAAVAKRLFGAHSGQDDIGVSTSSRKTGDKLTIEGEWTG
jgi:hypothetical protein